MKLQIVCSLRRFLHVILLRRSCVYKREIILLRCKLLKIHIKPLLSSAINLLLIINLNNNLILIIFKITFLHFQIQEQIISYGSIKSMSLNNKNICHKIVNSGNSNSWTNLLKVKIAKYVYMTRSKKRQLDIN